MTLQRAHFSDNLLDYIRQINPKETAVLADIRHASAQHRLGHMTIAPEQAQVLVWLAQLIGVNNYLEIGTFTGYSSTAMALSLPDTAHLTCCDTSVTFTDIAQQHWKNAGVAHKITLYVQPAIITLDHLIKQGACFDMALIDADKPTTPHYFERCLKLVRRGGLIAIDNVLLGGRIIDAQHTAPSHNIMHEFNTQLIYNKNIRPLTLPLGDGLTLVQKI